MVKRGDTVMVLQSLEITKKVFFPKIDIVAIEQATREFTKNYKRYKQEQMKLRQQLSNIN